MRGGERRREEAREGESSCFIRWIRADLLVLPVGSAAPPCATPPLPASPGCRPPDCPPWGTTPRQVPLGPWLPRPPSCAPPTPRCPWRQTACRSLDLLCPQTGGSRSPSPATKGRSDVCHAADSCLNRQLTRRGRIGDAARGGRARRRGCAGVRVCGCAGVRVWWGVVGSSGVCWDAVGRGGAGGIEVYVATRRGVWATIGFGGKSALQ